MKVGLLFHRNGSLRNLESVGQSKRFIDSYLKKYAKEFEKVYVFSYADETIEGLPENVEMVPNRTGLPATLYALTFPLIHRDKVSDCDAFRVFHINGTPSAIVSRVLFGKPYITTYGYMWMNDLLFHKKYLECIIAKPIEWFGLRLAKKVIITTGMTREHVLGFVGEDRIGYVPNGVDTGSFMKKSVKRGKKFRIVSVGRLYRIKNYDSLVRAAARIRDSEVVIYGEGPERPNLEKLAKEQGCDLKLPGLVPNERLPDELNKADVFVLPSHSEGMPKALLEAMACQLPCIVSNLPTLREIIRDGDNGLACGETAEDILEKIRSVQADPAMAGRLAKSARRYIEDNLSIDKLVSKEIKLLKDL